MKLKLIGTPCAGSLSPLLQRLFLEAAGLDGSYEVFEPSEEELPAFLGEGLRDGTDGMNVTVPYKSSVIPYLAAVDPEAARIGAVNTLVRRNDGFYGFNTDAPGLILTLRRSGLVLDGLPCLVLGTGGAARACLHALSEVGAKAYLWGRDRAKAARLAGEFPGTSVYENPDGSGTRIVLALNTTPCKAENDARRLVRDVLGYLPGKILNLAYSVKMSPEAAETEYEDGKVLLFYQGLLSFRYWTGVCFSEEKTEELLGRFLRLSSRSIVLTGFMGAGKSTVGRELAALLGTDCVDLDKELERRRGMSIPEIFWTEGEEGFRKAEAALLREYAEGTGCLVLSAGGGAVLREENRTLLRDPSLFTVWLDPPEEELFGRLANRTGRPLLEGKGPEEILALYRGRKPLYQSTADARIVSAAAPQDIAKEIVRKWSGY